MELTLDLPGLVKHRVTECMEWLQGDAENEDAVECGWRQQLEEDGTSSRLYPYGLNFVSTRNFTWWNPDSHGYGIHRWCLCEVMEL